MMQLLPNWMDQTDLVPSITLCLADEKHHEKNLIAIILKEIVRVLNYYFSLQRSWCICMLCMPAGRGNICRSLKYIACKMVMQIQKLF